MKIVYLSIFLIFAINVYAQTDYSGVYGLDGKSYSKDLTVLKIDATHYKFWIIAAGAKYANVGNGFFEVKGDSGICGNLDKSNLDFQWCEIIFRLTLKNIEVVSKKSEEFCQFLIGSHIFATYPLIKRKRISHKEFLEEYKDDYNLYKVISPKTVLYLDSSITSKKNHYFKKGDVLFESCFNTFYADKAIQIEFFSNAGDFIYGWIKKEEVVHLKE